MHTTRPFAGWKASLLTEIARRREIALDAGRTRLAAGYTRCLLRHSPGSPVRVSTPPRTPVPATQP